MTILVALVVLAVGGAVFLITEWLIGRRPNVQLEGYRKTYRDLEEADDAAQDASTKGQRFDEDGAAPSG